MPARCAWRCAPTSAAAIAGLWHRAPAGAALHRAGRRWTRARLSGCFPLVPYSNRLGYRRFRWKGADYSTAAQLRRQPAFAARRGLARGRGRSSRPARVDVVLRYRHAADADWPFAFEARQYFTLTPQAMRVQMVFTNLADVAAAGGPGLAPVLSRSARAAACTSSVATAGTATPRSCRRARWRSPASTATCAHLDFDNCFEGWRGAARIRDEKMSLQLSSSLDRPGGLHAAAARLLLRRAGEPRQQRDPHGRPAGARPAERWRRARRIEAWMQLEVARAVMPGTRRSRRCAWRAAPSLLGESPLWHPTRAGAVLVRHPRPAAAPLRPAQRRSATALGLRHRALGRCAPLPDGRLLLALRDGLWRFDPAQRRAPARWLRRALRPGAASASTTARRPAGALLGRHDLRAARPAAGRAATATRRGELERSASTACTVSNGLAWSPDGRTHVLGRHARRTSSTPSTSIPTAASLSRRRVFARFPAARRRAGRCDGYGGRPDGAAVDCRGLLLGGDVRRRSACCACRPTARSCAEVHLPVRCPTMPCFGGPDLKTLYITTARENRPADELAAQPLAGCVLPLDVDVPGLPVQLRACPEQPDDDPAPFERGRPAGAAARAARVGPRRHRRRRHRPGRGARRRGARLLGRAAGSARTSPRAPPRAPPSWCTAACATWRRATSAWCARRCTSAPRCWPTRRTWRSGWPS